MDKKQDTLVMDGDTELDEDEVQNISLRNYEITQPSTYTNSKQAPLSTLP